jgi:hypothetical protein
LEFVVEFVVASVVKVVGCCMYPNKLQANQIQCDLLVIHERGCFSHLFNTKPPRQERHGVSLLLPAPLIFHKHCLVLRATSASGTLRALGARRAVAEENSHRDIGSMLRAT